VPDVLLRRGSLALVRSPGTAGLFRVDDRGGWVSPGALDRAEWWWVLICAAPLALDVLGREADASSGESGQTVLEVG
jgi:hypothetical protein